MCWSLLAEDSQVVSGELFSLGVIQHLLYAMGNREHTDAQIQASLALEVHIYTYYTYICMHTGNNTSISSQHFVHSYPVIEEHVERGIGSTLFEAFMVSLYLLNTMIASVNRSTWKLLEGNTNRSNLLFLQHQADTLYMNMDETQAEILLTNKVNLTEGNNCYLFILRLVKIILFFRSVSCTVWE